MRKHDLLHLHTLLARCRRFVAEQEGEPAGAYDAYEALGVSPTDLTRQKDAHEEAVFGLLDGLEATIEGAERERTTDRIEPDTGHAD